MMELSSESSLNWVEFLSMRIGFSMYCGWLTTASILNFIFIVEATKKQMNKLDDDSYKTYS
jgi:polyferredoxin